MMTLLKVGPHYINMDNMTHVDEGEEGLIVSFRGTKGKQGLTLKGEQAIALRKWLNQNATHLLDNPNFAGGTPASFQQGHRAAGSAP